MMEEDGCDVTAKSEAEVKSSSSSSHEDPCYVPQRRPVCNSRKRVHNPNFGKNENANAEVVSKMMRKRTPLKTKSVNATRAVTVSSKESDTQCNLFHNASYSKGIQFAPEVHHKGSNTEKQVQYCDTATQFFPEDTGEDLRTDLITDIMDEDFIKPFLQTLERCGQLEDFKKLVLALKLERMPVDNISWLSALERAKYALCKSTTAMKYRKETLDFWHSVYLMFGNSALTVFRGSANFSQVVTQQCSRGRYDPQEGSCNFSVPSLTTLKKIKDGFHGHIPPGFVEATLKMAEEKCLAGKQFTLSFDGKKIAEGLKELDEGDCNLLGLERPKVKVRMRILEMQLEFAQTLCDMSAIGDVTLTRVTLQRSLSKLSRVIQNMQLNIKAKVRAQNKLKALSKANPNEKRYKFSISQINVRKHECDNNLSHALKLQEMLIEMCAKCEGLFHCYNNSGLIDLSASPLHFALRSPEHFGQVIDLLEDSDYIKQRTPLWFEMRKLARLTGSTMYDALGLEKLCYQQTHYDTFIKSLPNVKDSHTKERMQHGTQHEMSATATIVGKILPAYFPKCSRLIETGMKFYGTAEQPQMMEVSADGMILCCGGQQQCPHKELHLGQGVMMVEIKCSYPEAGLPHFPHENILLRYIPQCLAEMALYDSKILLFVSWTPETTAAFLVHFDADLWNNLINLACEFYGKSKCSRPQKWHPMSKHLKRELPKFKNSNVRLLCIVPSLRGCEGKADVSELSAHYTDSPELILSSPDIDELLDEVNYVGTELQKVFTECFHSLREPAQEVLVWMLNCKDRLQDKNTPNSAPLCYHLKGREFTIPVAKELRERVRKKLAQHNIDVLCETYDGQFHPIIVRTKNEEPLTKLQLHKQTWHKVQGLSKEKILQALNKASKLTKLDAEFIRASRCFIPGVHARGNVIIHKEVNPLKLGLSSRGSEEFPEGIVGEVTFAPVSQNAIQRNEGVPQQSGRTANMKGIKDDEVNILQSVHPELLEDLDLDELPMQNEEVEIAEDELPDLEQPPGALQRILSNRNFRLLQDILSALRDLNMKKWGGKTVHDLYPNILANAEKLYTECIIKDLQVIAKVMKTYTSNRTWYDGSENKTFNVNLISSAFESSTFVVDVDKEDPKFNAPSLAQMCKAAVMKSTYPVTSLRVSYANVLHKYAKEKWLQNATVQMQVPIPHVTRPHELFSYPEYSHERSQIEPRTFDPVHVLTKVRGHLCRSGYTFATKEAFMRIANEHPDILSKSIVIDMIDPQNAFIAERVISESVEDKCREMGFEETADFLSLFRRWFRAMNARGMSADDRVRAMYDMDVFLLSKISLDTFPLEGGLQYVQGMPIKTYEAILQMNATRIALYTTANGNCFNVRSVTTLPCESFFSDLTRCDREGHLYPKAANISRLMGRCVTVNNLKHNPSKPYELCTSNKSSYPVHLALEHRNRWQNEDAINFQGIYRNHFFDYPDQHNSQRVRRDEVTKDRSSLRGVLGVRQWYRTDESKLDPSHRVSFPLQ